MFTAQQPTLKDPECLVSSTPQLRMTQALARFLGLRKHKDSKLKSVDFTFTQKAANTAQTTLQQVKWTLLGVVMMVIPEFPEDFKQSPGQMLTRTKNGAGFINLLCHGVAGLAAFLTMALCIHNTIHINSASWCQALTAALPGPLPSHGSLILPTCVAWLTLVCLFSALSLLAYRQVKVGRQMIHPNMQNLSCGKQNS